MYLDPLRVYWGLMKDSYKGGWLGNVENLYGRELRGVIKSCYEMDGNIRD